MSIPDLRYYRPKSISEALQMLKEPEARALAGGQTLIPALKQRMLRPSALVDLQAIPEMKGIEILPDKVIVGAMTPHAVTASDPGIRVAIPALSAMASGIAHPQVRNVGTIGGAVANNDPAADYPAAILGLGAEIETTQRRIAADDFFLGLFETALQPSELVLRFHFPKPSNCGYVKFANPASGYVTAGAFVARGPAGLRVAINGAGPVVFRWTEAERCLMEEFAETALQHLKLSPDGLNNDIHASAAYRAQLAMVGTRRALRIALADLPQELRRSPDALSILRFTDRRELWNH